MRVTKRMLLVGIIGLSAAATLGEVVIDRLFESRLDRFGLFIRETARRLPTDEWSDYHNYTVFPAFGVMIRYAGQSWNIPARDQDAFAERSRDIHGYLAGSALSIISLELQEGKDGGGVAKLLVEWRPPASAGIAGMTTMGAELHGVETPDGWRVDSVKVYSAGELMELMGRNSLQLLDRITKGAASGAGKAIPAP